MKGLVVIKQQLVQRTDRISPGKNSIDYITIHETANTRIGANAQAHANLQSNGNPREASWHYQVDDQQIIQSFTDTTICWHAVNGNRQSIGIEICVNSDGDFSQAVNNAVMLVKTLMVCYHLDESRVVQHHFWTGKDCPYFLRTGTKGINWSQFIAMVKGTDVGQVGQPSPVPNKPTLTKLAVDGLFGPLTIRALQTYFGTPQDGVISKPSAVIMALQKWLGVKRDGLFGPITIRALQKRLGTPQDGKISKPSLVIKELQRRLNQGKL